MVRNFLFTFLFFLSLNTFGQTTYHVSQFTTAIFDKDSQHFIWDEAKPTDMTITKNGNVYSFTNAAKTVITSRDIYSSHNNGTEKKTIWNASDQNGKECNLILAETLQTGKMSISVVYIHAAVVVFHLD